MRVRQWRKRRRYLRTFQPPETRVICDICGATETIQRDRYGRIILSSTQPCIGAKHEKGSVSTLIDGDGRKWLVVDGVCRGEIK